MKEYREVNVLNRDHEVVGKAKVDEEDFERVSRFRWHLASKGYAKTSIRENGKVCTVRMHRLIVGAKPGEQYDHQNLDKLDNRRQNLRLATGQQNGANRGTLTNNSSGYKGVVFYDRPEHGEYGWRAQIYVRGKKLYLGLHKTSEAAAKAYDEAALEHFGEFARLNTQGE